LYRHGFLIAPAICESVVSFLKNNEMNGHLMECLESSQTTRGEGYDFRCV